jgi:hypothetical protein
MTASVKVSPYYNLLVIAQSAGVTDFSTLLYDNGTLYIEGIEQSALDAAMVSYSQESYVKELQMADIAATRFEHETGGIVVNGLRINTSRDSQGLILGATVQVIIDPTYTLRWKTPLGWVQFEGDQVTMIASIVRQHVQDCFDREETLVDAVNDGTFEESMLEQGWPDPVKS